jgi:SAM-dependent methyltransferase
MAKKIRFESFVYRFLAEAECVSLSLTGTRRELWAHFVGQLEFRYLDGNAVVASGNGQGHGVEFSLREPVLYRRGDNQVHVARQVQEDLVDAVDRVQLGNSAYFRMALVRVCESAGMDIVAGIASGMDAEAKRLNSETAFHDAWAASEGERLVDVRAANEVCTAPEMRFIRSQLGDISGKSLLDLGCGLGEASVYFALEGAEVTALDLSQGMLDATGRLATRYGVTIRLCKGSSEGPLPLEGEKFDVIYAGNLLHHVDIPATIRSVKPHLAAGGVFVSWDPIAYNPLINIYRAMATRVRTPDEHPLRWTDIRRFRSEFSQVTTRYFWLSTLIVFVLMATVQRRDPNKERFWKVVVEESDRWKPLFVPLSRLDRMLLTLLPPLRLLCWNVVILARGPI